MHEPASFTVHRRSAPWLIRSAWPFSWVNGPDQPPCVDAYRLRFTSAEAETLSLVVTADERYRLYLDGRLLRSGPEVGSRWCWQADAFAVAVPAGEHLLLAVVWSVGERDGDFATDGIRHGFALGVDGPANGRFATGSAAWEWHALPGYTFRKSPLAHWTVPDLYRNAAATDWAAEVGAGTGWGTARIGSPVHHVADVEAFPARLVEIGTLPPPLYRPWTALSVKHAETLPDVTDPTRVPLATSDPALEHHFGRMLTGEAPLHLPARTVVRAVLDCGTYLTAWPEFAAGGAGARVRLEWMEALNRTTVTGPHDLDKGQRDEIAGRYVRGLGDEVHCDGELRRWRPLYWRSGRFLIITVHAGEQPAILAALRLYEDRYPLEQEARLEVAHEGLTRVLPLCLRTLQVNAHDLFSDTPYFERMQYLGDCRIDCLNTYVLTRDDRLAVKALRMTHAQRLPDGLTVSRGPTRNLQVLPTFSLWYVGMLRDHLWWRGDLELVRELIPGVRGVLEAFLRHRLADGTLGFMEGWNFCDWTPPFVDGEPPGSRQGASPANLQLLMALGWAEDLDTALAEPELAARWRRLRLSLAQAITTVFWDEGHGLWADDRAHRSYSQHAQALAALCPDLDPDRRRRGLAHIGSDPNLAPASLYFLHYLLEAWATVGDGQSIVDAFAFWSALPAQGFCTLPESPEPSRSDCHAWSAHPLYHLAATLAGIRPAAPGFARVRIAPCLGCIPAVTVRIPHPGGGWIAAELQSEAGCLRGRIELPPGITGSLEWAGKDRLLSPGVNDIICG